MADIQLVQCKNQQKTSSYCLNSVPYNKIGIKESNDDVRKIMVKDLWQRSGLAWFCACAESCVVFNTGPYIVLPDNSILITLNMQSETGFPSSHQLKSYVASKSRLKLAAHTVLSADAGLLVNACW